MACIKMKHSDVRLMLTDLGCIEVSIPVSGSSLTHLNDNKQGHTEWADEDSGNECKLNPFEPHREKTRFLPMRKQRRRSASQ